MQRASILVTKDKVIIHPVSTTTVGVGLATQPYFHLSRGASDNDIVTTIFKALSLTVSDLAHPKQTEWKNLSDSYLKDLQFKSSTLLHKSCSLCEISEDDSHLYFTPMLNHITKKHFTPLSSKVVSVSKSADIQVIASKLLEALNECEPQIS